MTEWIKIALNRAKNAVKALDLLAKTAGRNYDVPAVEAAAMLGKVRDAHDALLKAYGQTPVVAEPEAEASAPKPRPVWRDPPHQDQIARFVADVPSDQVSSYITHLVHRLCERADAAKAED